MATLLSLKNLTVTLTTGKKKKKLINGIDLDIPKLSIVGLVGGSGSGKTTTGLSILRLLAPGLQVQHGRILFERKNILRFSQQEMCRIRGNVISMIFQEPLQSFNPVFTLGYQIEEVLEHHTDLNKQQRKERVLDLLNQVELPDPKRIVSNYPHELSGGMRQRAMIAQAIAAKPKLIIADEPTSNLDVTLQAKIIELFEKLKKELQLSILLITHDLGMVKHLSDHVAVMNEGKIVEQGPTQDVLQKPKHEYTQQLKRALL